MVTQGMLAKVLQENIHQEVDSVNAVERCLVDGRYNFTTMKTLGLPFLLVFSTEVSYVPIGAENLCLKIKAIEVLQF